MNLSKVVISTILCLLISACQLGADYESSLEQFVPKQEAEFGKDYFSKLRSGDFGYVTKYLSPDIKASSGDTTSSGRVLQSSGDTILNSRH